MERKILRIPEVPEDKVVLLNISRCYNCTDPSSIYFRPNVYEMTRKFWKADKDRTSQADYVFGVADGKVVGVFKNAVWEYMEFNGYQRVGFTAEEVHDSPYLGLDLSEYVRVQNPIRYVNF